MKKTLLLCLFAILGTTFLFAQSQEIKGTVTDQNGKPLQGAVVVPKGKKTGTNTNANGEFTLKVADAKDATTLTISYVGYKTQIVTVSNKSAIKIKMEEEATTQEEVVVQTGLGGSIKKKELTASVATVGAKDLKDVPINSAAEALNGRLAGVTATTSEGSPDADIKIRVRGGSSITQDNSPLYIVDGVQVENGLNTVVLQDIQDITVLKDAAALSVYGARGANGVIIITTKTGKVGDPKVTYNMFWGVKNLRKTLDVMSPYEYVLYNYERSLQASPVDTSTFFGYFGRPDTFAAYKNAAPVDWQRNVLGNTGYTQMHNLGLSGGIKKWSYNFGYTYNDDKAIVLNSKYKRHQVNLKNDFRFSEKLKATLGIRYTSQNVLGAGVSSDASTSYNRLRNAVKYRPFLFAGEDLLDDDPGADPNPGNGLGLINPYQIVDAEYRRKTTNQFNVSASISYNITKHLSFKSTFGYDKKEILDRQFTDSNSSYSVIYGSKKPVVNLDTTNNYSINNSNIFTYSFKNLKKRHDIELVVGEESLEQNTSLSQSLFRYYPNFISKDSAFNFPYQLAQSDPGYPKLYKSKATQLSFFGIARYSYLKRYFVTFTYRADGSSKFIDENKWGYFPSASFAWRVSNEKFFEKVKFINDFKIRLAYGAVGNNRIDDYLFSTNFTTQSYYYGLNGQTVTATNPTALANQKLKWESLINKNLGVDLSLFKNKIDLSVDYFINQSSDLLLNVPIASTYGYAYQLQNIGKTSSSGVEIQISSPILQSKNGLNWNSSFNISFAKNKVDALGVGMQSLSPATSWGVNGAPADYITKIGEQVGAMYGYVTDGFYKTDDFNYNATTQEYTLKAGVVNNSKVIGAIQPGSIKFKDINGDTMVDQDHDRTIIGNPNPKFTGGFSNSFTYKNWDASIFVNFSYGNDIYNANKIEFTNGYINRSNMIKDMENRWKTVADDGTQLQWTKVVNVGGSSITKVYGAAPSVLDSRNSNASMWQPLLSSGAFQSHSYAIEDGSFLRINNITIGYSLPIKALIKLHITKLRVYATANNVAIFTNYSGYDPEVSVRKNPLTPNLDYSAYPKSRSFIFGLNVTF